MIGGTAPTPGMLGRGGSSRNDYSRRDIRGQPARPTISPSLMSGVLKSIVASADEALLLPRLAALQGRAARCFSGHSTVKQLSTAVWLPFASRAMISNLISSPGSVSATGISNAVTSGGRSAVTTNSPPSFSMTN